jgi:hypothetical protein
VEVDAIKKYNIIYSTIICDDDSTSIWAVSKKWSYEELLSLQPAFEWPRTIKRKKPTKDAFH